MERLVVAKKLVITVPETARWHGRSTVLALLDLFHHRGLPDATATRSVAGYTGKGAIAQADIVDISASLPIRIEVTDSAATIERVLPDVYDIVERGLVEVQEVQAARLTGEETAPTAAPKIRLVGPAKMLQVHFGQDDTWEGEPLYETIVKRARELDIAGATVYRGVLGYGAHKRLHKHRPLALSKDDPVLVTVVDEKEKVDRLVAALDQVVTGGCLIVLSDVTVVRYEEHGPEPPRNE
jgi:PII-like signaling protein